MHDMKTFCIALLIALTTMNGFGQDKGRKERIKTLKIAFITERLSLTEDEAEKFWPVYNKFDDAYDKLRHELRSSRKDIDVAGLSEDQAKTIIKSYIEKENKKAQLKENFMKDLMKILSAKKIVQLQSAEDAFNKKMFEEYRKRHNKQ